MHINQLNNFQFFWRTADNAFCELSISLCSSSEPQLFIETLVLNIILMIIPPLTATTIKPMTEELVVRGAYGS